jgi:hypothetical protein
MLAKLKYASAQSVKWLNVKKYRIHEYLQQIAVIQKWKVRAVNV